MKKVKNPRGKIRGKSMKKIFACLLSLSMIPANGVAVFATQKQAENASVQKNADVKTQANNTQESKVTFAQDSLVSKIGYFKNYKFEGIDEEDIASVQFEFIADGVLSLYPNYGQDKNGKYHVIGYSIDPKKTGDTRITAHITTTSGEVLTTPATKFKVESAESDVVPFTDTGLFNAVKSNLNLDSNTTHITKEQMKQVKKISGYLSDGNIDGIEYAENCEEVSLPNSYELSDISKLAQLTKLKKVNISNSQVMNITALQWLKNLTYVNLNNTKVSTEDRFSLFKTNDVSIEEGTKVTDLLNPKGLVQTSDTITSSDPSVISVQQEKKSNGTSEWVFKAAEGTEGKEATLTIQNDTQKKQIKVNVVAKDNSLPDFAEKSVETNIGCFLKVPLKNVDAKGSNLKFSSSDNTILDIAEKRSYQGYNEYSTTYYFEPQKEGKVTLIGYIEKDDGTKYKRTMEVTVQKVKENVVPIKDYEIFRNISNNEDYTTEITWDDLKDKKELYLYNSKRTIART